MSISTLKKEIEEQTRNGREEVYIKLEDLKLLDEHLAGNYGDKRMMINVDYIEELIAKYENKHSFKNDLKVNVKPRVVTSDEFCDKIDELEKQYDREIDD